MPKIRGIKPDFWTDEDIADLSIPARLLFIGMWTYACDNGHLDDKPRQLKMKVFPADDIDIAPLLDELARARRIERDGITITIPKFAFHQRPHKRWWTTCGLPLCTVPDGDEQRGKGAMNRGSQRGNNGGSTVDQPYEGDGEGDGEGELPSVVGAAKAAKAKRATQRPAGFRPGAGHIALAQELGIDLLAEWQQFCDHHDARGSTFKSWPAALNTWIRNAAKFGRSRPAGATPRQQADQEMFDRQMARAQAREAGAEP